MRSRTSPGQLAHYLRHLRRQSRLAARARAIVRSASTRIVLTCMLATSLLAALAGGLSGCSRANSAPQADTDKPLLVFAAANMRDALSQIARNHRAAGGDSVALVFGSTGDLATQITNGAPADLFFAANTEAIDRLSAEGHVVDTSRVLYAVGRLAVLARCTRAHTAIAGECPRLALADLAKDSLRNIAIADPSHAPYGRAAQQALQRAGLWDAIRPRLVMGANVSQAELFVTSGNADAGIVALSVLRREGNGPYTLIDASLHDPLVQSAAIVSRSSRGASAAAFIAYVQSEAGQHVLQRYGFESPSSRMTFTGDR